MLGSKREEPGATVTRINPAEAHTVLGREARFEGKLTFEGAVRIDGKLEGEIFTDDLLLIGPGAEVKASLQVGSVVIHGTVEGDVTAKESVELKAPGRLKGNVTTPSLVIEKGVVFDGTATMSGLEAAPPDRRAPPASAEPSGEG
jgi:cytoskeletal protein CcmA (bactofilin family)